MTRRERLQQERKNSFKVERVFRAKSRKGKEGLIRKMLYPCTCRKGRHLSGGSVCTHCGKAVLTQLEKLELLNI